MPKHPAVKKLYYPKHFINREKKWVTRSTIKNWMIVLRVDGRLQFRSKNKSEHKNIIARYLLIDSPHLRRALHKNQWSVVKSREIPDFDADTDDEDVKDEDCET